jgi:hypothetical protein
MLVSDATREHEIWARLQQSIRADSVTDQGDNYSLKFISRESPE